MVQVGPQGRRRVAAPWGGGLRPPPQTVLRTVCPAGPFLVSARVCGKRPAGKPTVCMGSDRFGQHGLNAEKTIIFGSAFAAAGSAGFYLAAGGGSSQVGNGGVLRFAAAVA